MIGVVRKLGYDNEADIRARVCQDLVLEAIRYSLADDSIDRFVDTLGLFLSNNCFTE